MTPQEFKSWFDGFTEALPGVPTKAQWERIKSRVGEIDGKPVTERVFVDRYYPSYPPRYWGPSWQYYSANAATHFANTIPCNTAAVGRLAQNSQSLNAYSAAAASFNSTDAMADLGRADAKALAA
jgi:hypothetical protein